VRCRRYSAYVDGAALALQCKDDVGRADSLSLAHFDNGADVKQQFLQVVAKVQPGLSVDRRRNALHTTATSQTTDVRLCNT
jgi:hypothetical protein